MDFVVIEYNLVMKGGEFIVVVRRNFKGIILSKIKEVSFKSFGFYNDIIDKIIR